MDKSFYRVLILDVDSETLITLQHVLENAGIDTTIKTCAERTMPLP